MSDAAHDRLTRSSFTRQRALFEGPNSPFARRTPGPLTWIAPLEADMDALEVACGAAHAAEQVAPEVHHVTAIDLTPALLEVAAARLRDSGVANVTLQEANAEALPFGDASFDLVFCRSSLHHFANPYGAVAEMERVCRGEGRIVLLDVVAPSPEARDAFDHVHRLLDPSHVRSFTEAELAALLPGRLTYAETTTYRFPIDVAITEQSNADEVLRILRSEDAGFAPVEEDGKLVVSFTTCVVHGPPR